MHLKKLEMRNRFIDNLCKYADNDESIILIVGDLGFNVVEKFQKKYPKQFINAGICEQSMASMAAGMAKEGFKVFIYSIANFPTFRCAEQIRNDICYHNLDVTIVTVGGGLSYGSLGYSHHAIQDYGLMRLFPEISIISPGDPNEVDLSFEFIMRDTSPKYLRLRKTGEPIFNKNEKLELPGFWNRVKEGRDNKALLSTGYGLKLAFDLVKTNKFQNYSIFSCPIWGNKYKKFQFKQILKHDKIITIEDHLLSGGFGSWIRESIINKKNNINLGHAFIDDDIIGKVGSEEYLLKYMTIDE